MKNQIEKSGFKVKEASISFKAKNLIKFRDKKKQDVLFNFLSKLEDLDDVLKVFCNADFVLKD